ncbi:MAG: PepSY domain-containing protein [Rhodanobacter sp.]
MPLPHRLIRLVRAGHLYLGVFTAPMLLFLAVSGGLQTFGLHEAGRDGSYQPSAWLASMAQLHKKQTLQVPVRRPRPTATTAPMAVSAPAAHPLRRNPLPMKVFFAVVALGLFASVCSGLYMAWRFSRRPRVFGAVLFGGIAVPLLLLLA